jgi:spermidine/putrescine transport system permease protein
MRGWQISTTGWWKAPAISALSIDDYIIASFTIGSGNTLPTLVWGMIRTGLTPSVNAIGTLILILTIGSSLIALRLTRYRG